MSHESKMAWLSVLLIYTRLYPAIEAWWWVNYHEDVQLRSQLGRLLRRRERLSDLRFVKRGPCGMQAGLQSRTPQKNARLSAPEITRVN